MFSCSLNACIYFLHRGIRHYAFYLGDIFAGIAEDADNVIINAILFDRPAPVDQHDIIAVFFQLIRKMFYRAFSKIQFCRIAV